MAFRQKEMILGRRSDMQEGMININEYQLYTTIKIMSCGELHRKL